MQANGEVTQKVEAKVEDNGKGCKPPLDISEDSLHYQLGEFSRNF